MFRWQLYICLRARKKAQARLSYRFSETRIQLPRLDRLMGQRIFENFRIVAGVVGAGVVMVVVVVVVGWWGGTN